MTINASARFALLSWWLLSSVRFGVAANCSNEKQPLDVGSASASAEPDRSVSWSQLVPNILCDQKNIWLFPVRMAQDHNWVPVIAIAGTTAGLLAADPIEGRYFHQTSAFAGYNQAFSSTNTEIVTILAPAALYAAGWARKDVNMKTTALLAGEAAFDSEIVATVLKDVTSRKRPYSFSPADNYADSFYDHSGSKVVGGGGFPSGHTIAAFSIATVVAHRYRQHRWVPYVAYSAATAVGFSRLSLSQHFASDVFVGAALGYSISRFAVMRY